MTIVTRTRTGSKRSDIAAGKEMYAVGEPFEDCTSEAMRSGWLLAERASVEWYATEIGDVVVMDEALAEMRAGVTEVVRLSDEQMREIEDERIGTAYCEYPWNY